MDSIVSLAYYSWYVFAEDFMTSRLGGKALESFIQVDVIYDTAYKL